MTKNEIISAISERTGVSRSEVRLFLDKFNETILEGLNEEQLVKIKGLGTFKMVSVKARKSVNVNGGEAIEIPAHNKVTFTAEKVFAEMVNEPLAHLEVAELVEEGRMKKLSDDAEEVKGLLADINGVSMGGSERVEEQPEEKVVEVESSKEEPEDRPEEESSGDVEEESEEQPKEPTERERRREEENIRMERERRETMTHGGKMGRIFLWCMVLLLVIVGVIYWVSFSEEDEEVEEVAEVTEVEEVAEVAEEKEVERRDSIVVEEKKAVVEKVGEGRLSIEQMRGMKVDYTVLQGTETVRDGSRLTMISLRAYGDKRFWIYIYLANREQLSSPGQISTGMEIKIPKMDRRMVDASNPDCLQYAKELEGKYVK